MAVVINGTTGITNDGGYTGDGIVFADTTPANTLVTTTSGNVGIGTSSPNYKVTLNGGGSASVLQMCNTASGITANDGFLIYQDGADCRLQNTEAGNMLFYTGNTERARIDTSGNLLVGTTNHVFKLSVQGDASTKPLTQLFSASPSDLAQAVIQIIKTDNNSTTSQIIQRFLINSGSAGSGQINANGANACAFGAYSDSRLKENIVDLPSQLANIMALRPVEYDYIESEGGGHQIGFVAQEVQAVYPDLVGEREDGMLTLSDMNKNDARLIKAIQEQQALIVSLQDTVTSQAEALASLTTRLAALEAK